MVVEAVLLEVVGAALLEVLEVVLADLAAPSPGRPGDTPETRMEERQPTSSTLPNAAWIVGLIGTHRVNVQPRAALVTTVANLVTL